MTDNAPTTGGTCLRCGYDLTGLDDRNACPECGLLAGLSRTSGEELRHNRPRWLTRLTVGATLLAASVPLTLLVSIGFAILNDVVIDIALRINGAFIPAGLTYGKLVAVAGLRDWLLFVTSVVLILGGSILFAIGTWLLTSRPRSGDAGDRTSLVCRFTSLGALLLATVSFLSAPGFGVVGVVPEWLNMEWIAYVGLALGGVTIILLSLRLRRLADRAPAPLLAADSPVVGIVLGGLVLAITLYMLLMNEGLAPPPPAKGLEAQLFFGVLAIVFALTLTAAIWSIYLLIRYALAFNKTRRQALQIFADADKSATA